MTKINSKKKPHFLKIFILKRIVKNNKIKYNYRKGKIKDVVMKQIGLGFAYKNGKIADISEVDRGLKCECSCPLCGAKLIANKGKKNRHHFKHYRVEECSHYGETLLHLASKQIIKESKEILFPIFDINRGWYSKEKIFSYKQCEEEKKVENIIPDIILYFENNNKIFVEIKVTHEVDEDKIEKLKEIGISTLEIDLSKEIKGREDVLNLEELKEKVLYGKGNRTWVYDKNYKVKQAKYREKQEYEEFLEAMEKIDKEEKRNFYFERAYKRRMKIYNDSIKGLLRKNKFGDLYGFFFLEEENEEVMVTFEQMKSTKCESLRYVLTEYQNGNYRYALSKMGALFENKGKLTGDITITENKVKVEIIKESRLKNWEYEIRVKKPNPKKL